VEEADVSQGITQMNEKLEIWGDATRERSVVLGELVTK
jgi:hypothetical protein